MATFVGTSQEFKAYIGPRLCNIVNLITKKHKSAIGACEHCGSGEYLESAHVRGRERTEIIDLLLGASDAGNAFVVDLEQFEKAFKFEHKPFEKAILILCRDCHRKYDSRIVHQHGSAGAGPIVGIEGVSTGSRVTASDILPITLDPPNVSVFKERLLNRKAAEFTIFYGDGRMESRPWDASRFSETSNVFGNLRSRPELRQGEWQSRGIVKVHVRVLGDA